jgi:hypothetical protein
VAQRLSLKERHTQLTYGLLATLSRQALQIYKKSLAPSSEIPAAVGEVRQEVPMGVRDALEPPGRVKGLLPDLSEDLK